MRICHILPTTDKVICTAFRREAMSNLGIHSKANCAEIFLVDFTKVGVLSQEDRIGLEICLEVGLVTKPNSGLENQLKIDQPPPKKNPLSIKRRLLQN